MKAPLRTLQLAVGYVSRQSHRTVLSDLNLSVRSGELVCLLGPNGIGKSTLLRTLCGIQPPVSGLVEVDGLDVRRLSSIELARRVGVVLTERPLIGALPAYRLVELGRYPHIDWLGRLGPRDRDVVDWAIRAVSATHLASRDSSKLSDGERQRFMIARALAQEPSILLLDEPTAFLDVASRAELMGLLRQLARQQGLVIVVSTHDLELALRVADTLWLIAPGGQLYSGAPEDIIVAGKLREAFPAEAIEFYPEERIFRPVIATRGSAVVYGQGLHAALAAAVLEREGFEVVENAAGALRLMIDPDRLNWELVAGESRSRGDTFAALAESARSLKG